jgi:hypothetical protein
LDHRVTFEYDTQIRRTGTSDVYQSVGGTQAPEYEPGRAYNRFLVLPPAMTVNLTSNLLIDVKTIIRFRGVELATREISGAITVLAPPPPRIDLQDLRMNANGELIAVLTGAQSGKQYWVESSGDLITWLPRYSLTATGTPLSVSLPLSPARQQFYRVKAE